MSYGGVSGARRRDGEARAETQRPDELSGRRLLATVKERLAQLTALAAKSGATSRHLAFALATSCSKIRRTIAIAHA